MPPEAPNRRERNRLRTYRALEQAALELFTSQGYEHTTIEEIADRADVSLRTFFRYFATKDQTLFNDLPPRADELRRLLLARPPAEPPWTKLREAYCAVARQQTEAELETIKVRYHLIRTTPALFARHAEHSRFEQQQIVDVLAPGSPDADVRLLVSIAYATIWHALDQWVSTATIEDLADSLESAFRSVEAAFHPRDLHLNA